MKIRVIWFQAFLLLLIVVSPLLGLSYAANDVATIASLAVMLAVLVYLSSPMETVEDMRQRILGGDSSVKKFILVYLVPIWMVIFIVLTAVISFATNK